MPAQFQQGNSEVRLERPDLAEDGALFALIEELLGQEKQVPWIGGQATMIDSIHKRCKSLYDVICGPSYLL
jgi:hypothetical protein